MRSVTKGLSGRWVPVISRGFTVVSQPVDRILLPWLANPCNPAMSPHSRHPSTLNESVEERKREGGVGVALSPN